MSLAVEYNFKEKQLERLMDMYGTTLLRMAYIYLEDYALAEDAVQESFIKAYMNLNSLDGINNEKAWLVKITINTCKDFNRKAWFRSVDRAKSIEDLMLKSEDNTDFDDDVISVVMSLSCRYKEIILLYFYQNMKIKEMSNALNISEGTVSTRLQRAKALMKKKLKGWYFDEQ